MAVYALNPSTQRQVNFCELETSLAYIISSRPSKAT